MASNPQKSLAAQTTLFTKMVAGVNLHVLSPILLGGQTLTATQIVAVLTAYLQANIDLAAAKVAYQQKLVAQKAAKLSADQLAALLKAYAQGAYGKSNPILGDFGWSAAKPMVKSVKVKAEAAVKGAATRVARNTLGSKQKEGIHGVVPTATPGLVTPAGLPSATPQK